MANLLQAKKRIKQSETARERSRARKSVLKTQTRVLLDSIRDGDLEKAKSQFVTLTKKLDQVAATSTMHKKSAARRKSRLAKRLNAAISGTS